MHPRLTVPTCTAAIASLLTLTAATARAQTPPPVCGNGVIETGEMCDDGNALSGDGCSATCQIEDQCYDTGNAFSFFLWSDSYTSAGDSGVQRLLADAVDRNRYPTRVIPRFWIATGDIPFMTVSSTYLDDLNATISNTPDGANYPFMCSAGNGQFPYFVAIGNHDIDGVQTMTPAAEYDYWRTVVGSKASSTLVGLTNFQVGPNNGYDSLTNYSFDYKNAHFVVVNQYYADPTYPTDDPVACIRPGLYQWIDQDLAQSTKPVKFVFGHEPAWSYCSDLAGYGGDACPATNLDNQTPASRTRPYSTTGPWLQPFGEHWGDSLEDARCPDGSREAFWNMLAGHGVVAHFAGHTHTYSGRLVQGDGTRRNDVAAYGKTGDTYGLGEGVWEVNTGQAHNSAGTAYVLVTVQDDHVTFEGYDQITADVPEPFQLIESWNVSLSGTFNHAPTLSAIPAQSVVVPQTLTFTASASDPDAGQTLTFSLVGAPAGAAIDPATAVFTWTPTLAQVGSYTIWVKATDSGSPAASASQPVAVTVSAPPPDLLETAVGASPSVAAPGNALAVTDTVTNQGTNVTTTFVVGFHLSADAAFGGGDDIAFGSTRTIKSLASSASSTGSTTLTLPKTLSPGTYYVCASADTSNAIAESNEANNSLCGSTPVRVTRPDLTMTSLQPGTTAVRAKGTATLPVTDTVQNLEAIAAAGFKIDYHLSIDAVYGGTDDVALNATRSIGSLAGGASNTATTNLGIPDKTRPGSYYVCAKADSTNAIVELSESNNTICSATPVRIDP